jgi:dihydrofolate synthase/folylpolyglutamate synthase
MLLFRGAECQACVLEVGLGGRLDATNLVDADVAVLCSVGMDHADWLGNSLALIGREKAGVFRAGQQVVLGSDDLPASVHERLSVLGVSPAVAGRDFRWQVQPDGSWQFDDGALALAALPAPSLAGAIQYRNAATAIAAARRLLAPQPLSAQAVAAALLTVQLPGRLQFLPGPVQWVLDVAHNEPAAQVLARELEARPVRGRTIGVLGMLGDKDVAAVVQALAGIVDGWILCGIDEPRGLDVAALRARLPGATTVLAEARDVAGACTLASERSTPGDRVLVCGSFHTVGPALQWLRLY